MRRAARPLRTSDRPRFALRPRLTLPLAAAALALACSPSDDGATPGADPAWDADSRQELLSMADRDREVREGFGPEALADTVFVRRMAAADTAHTRRLRTLVDSLGWPAADEVGTEGLEAAFLLIQHATDTAFQRRLLPEVEEDVRAGRLDPQDYALLVDRTRQRAGGRQLYGTQLTLVPGTREARLDPIADSASVDDRREALGLPTLGRYLEVVEVRTGFDVVGWEPAPPDSAEG